MIQSMRTPMALKMARCVGVLALLTTLSAAPQSSASEVLSETPGHRPAHWSLTPLEPLQPPPDAPHPIDAFIQSKLAAAGLAPVKTADRRTLIRRLSYDLTGLPPTPEEVEAFVATKNPQIGESAHQQTTPTQDDPAYSALVERLLASPRYGEHWARHWLDVANYADTHGNDHDYQRPNAWPYRDYVIRAFNSDKPYPRFVQEQVAGDVLFPQDPWATVALGFIAAGPWDHTLMVTVRADTIDHRIAQNLDRDNMVSKVMGTFQSLTVHCARCHDHKFDPISQREYYSLQAVFSGVDRADRPFDMDPNRHQERQELLREKHLLAKRHPAILSKLDSPVTAQLVTAWEDNRTRMEAAWEPLQIFSVISTGGTILTQQTDGSWLASGPRPDRDTYWITARWPGGVFQGLRLQTLPDDSLPHRGPGRWDNGNFHLTELRAFAAPPGSNTNAHPLVFSKATADFDEGPEISAAQALDGKDETHWGIHPRYGEPHTAVFEVHNASEWPDGTTLTFTLENQAGAPGHGIGRFHLSATRNSPVPPPSPLSEMSSEIANILQIPAENRSTEQRRQLAHAILMETNARALAALPPPQWVYAVTHDFPPDGPNFTPPDDPRPIHRLIRGDLNRPGERVEPGTLSCLPGLPSHLDISDPDDESTRRAALAQWLTDSNNVLTWRSIVNRVWAWHFGRGLCDTPNDFGHLGDTPSHRELLDWLAVWFRDEAKGSFKALHRLILTSNTWKQSSLANHGLEHDPENRLLWRSNRKRLTGEQVRDSLLHLSGQINLTEGGPPAVQFNSNGDATFMSGGNPPYLDYAGFNPDSEAARRRAIYRFVFRTVPDPFMDALDCPDGSTPTPVRATSSTAQQALAMLNDPFALRQCEHIAERITTQTSSVEERIDQAFRLILLRPATATERHQFSDYTQRHGLANACQILLNSNEFLYLD